MKKKNVKENGKHRNPNELVKRYKINVLYLMLVAEVGSKTLGVSNYKGSSIIINKNALQTFVFIKMFI